MMSVDAARVTAQARWTRVGVVARRAPGRADTTFARIESIVDDGWKRCAIDAREIDRSMRWCAYSRVRVLASLTCVSFRRVLSRARGILTTAAAAAARGDGENDRE
mmetsp:Transcript_7815/g.17556  ORF Transcript_7815/g.17556 Transcript_7815/m.17556 type:complete len:106 (+) Transcript_7815:1344-1661(+)